MAIGKSKAVGLVHSLQAALLIDFSSGVEGLGFLTIPAAPILSDQKHGPMGAAMLYLGYTMNGSTVGLPDTPKQSKTLTDTTEARTS